MKKVVLILLLSFYLCGIANAANYVEIIKDDDYIAYLDLGSIKQNAIDHFSANEYGDIVEGGYRETYLVARVKWILRGNRAKEIRKNFKDASYCMMTYAFSQPTMFD